MRRLVNKSDRIAKLSVEYPCERSTVHSPKRQDKFETNSKIKRKQNELKLKIRKLFHKTEVESGAHEG